MKKSIFEIGAEYLQIIDQIHDQEGEITPELETQLAINEKELEVKSIAYIQVLKSVDGNIDMIDKEIKRLQTIKKANTNLKDRLKKAIINAMNLFEVQEIKTALNKISFRKSTSVNIEDVESLPSDCVIIEKKAISKTELKKRILAGEEIKGVSIVENKLLQIK